jgi:16S rRNA (guanine527-N7)-methyltransferase
VKRLDALVAQWQIPAPGAGALAAFLDLLERDDTAPTTVRDPALAVDAHIADALTGLAVPELAAAATVADLGAGAGVPGLVLAAARPMMRVAAIESTARKCAFLERAIATMGLGNAEVVCARAEEWEAGRGACDAVTARAVAPLPVLVEYAAPLLRMGGVLVAYKGACDAPEEADGAAAAEILGLEPAPVVAVPAFPGADRRSLHVYLKVGSLPNGFPRRAGIARKRPLRASTAG